MSATDPTANNLTDTLVLDGQRSPTATRGWCERGPDHLRLATPEGFFRPRCKRRDCPRCWTVRSRELARCLLIDARAERPTVCVGLTTRDPDTSPATYRQGSKSLFRRLRRRYGRVEYFGAIEFTTGRARTSGGHRRLHGHYLVKGLPATEAPAIEELVRETWQAITGAWVVEAAELRSPGAALGYLGLHHRKPEQAPPAAWRGMTERASRRYWHRPIADLRALARAELAIEAHAHRTGLPLELTALEVAAREPGRLIELRRLGDGPLVEPLGEFSGRLPDETREAIAAARWRWR
jgi:hypothetical protein